MGARGRVAQIGPFDIEGYDRQGAGVEKRRGVRTLAGQSIAQCLSLELKKHAMWVHSDGRDYIDIDLTPKKKTATPAPRPPPHGCGLPRMAAASPAVRGPPRPPFWLCIEVRQGSLGLLTAS